MVDQNNSRYYVAIPPQSISGGATVTSAALDMAPNGIPFDYAEIIEISGAIGANGVPTFQLSECDTSGGTFVNITAGVLSALSANNEINLLFSDLRKRKRYLKVSVTNGATNASVLGVIVRKTRGKQTPVTAAARNVDQLVQF